jgi:hypothetical protein
MFEYELGIIRFGQHLGPELRALVLLADAKDWSHDRICRAVLDWRMRFPGYGEGGDPFRLVCDVIAALGCYRVRRPFLDRLSLPRLSATGEQQPERCVDALERTIAGLWATGDLFGLCLESGGSRIGFCDSVQSAGYENGELRVQPDWPERLAEHPLGKADGRLLLALEPIASGQSEIDAHDAVWLDPTGSRRISCRHGVVVKCNRTGRVRYARDLPTALRAFLRPNAAERQALHEECVGSIVKLYRIYGRQRIANLKQNRGKSDDLLLPFGLAEEIRANLIACGERLGGARGRLIVDGAKQGYSLIELCCRIKRIRIRPIDRPDQVCCTADGVADVRTALLDLPMHHFEGFESSHEAIKAAASRARVPAAPVDSIGGLPS